MLHYLALLCISLNGLSAWTASSYPISAFPHSKLARCRSPPPARGNGLAATAAASGADIEQPPVGVNENTTPPPRSESDIPMAPGIVFSVRGKVNEIDFCIAPADVSLSRAYRTAEASSKSSASSAATDLTSATNSKTDSVFGLSLTRALNNASNRAVRRILLARCWPSAEALNRSLRQVAAIESNRVPIESNARDSNKATSSFIPLGGKGVSAPVSKARSRTDDEYVADQLKSFSDTYGTLPGYTYAQDYLECVLSLATSGIEPADKVKSVVSSGIYDEAYKRILSVLRTVGVAFIVDPVTMARQIAPKLKDKDICLSMLDKIQIRRESTIVPEAKDLDAKSAVEPDMEENIPPVESKKNRFRLKFWETEEKELPKEGIVAYSAVLLASNEATMTLQLNTVSNIVQRALLFGGDQELLVLAETLASDRAAFAEKWYPGTKSQSTMDEGADARPGVNYLNCLILLLRKCYESGVVTDLDPPQTLPTSYANSYERLVAGAVELGSGYIKPSIATGSIDGNVGLVTSMPKPRTPQEELGRFAVWESNFRQSAASSSSSSTSPQSPLSQYSLNPVDLVGTWDVRDEIIGEIIGRSNVVLLENGKVQVAPPLEGLRWRLDPGPTHLDTCTFQVLSTLDGTILQYRGFIDRGARLEARFSKRPIQILGSVMFQMRDGASVDYYKDMLPINYKTGTTKFVMTKTGS